MQNRVLVVEDDPRLAEMVRDYLRREGFLVEVEGRGDRALERIRSERPDAVLLDLRLPGTDGLSICRALRHDYGGAILMMTARGDEVDEVLGLELGADDYLTKPVRPRVLLARLRAALRHRGSGAGGGAGAPELIRLGELHIQPIKASTTKHADKLYGSRQRLRRCHFADRPELSGTDAPTLQP